MPPRWWLVERDEQGAGSPDPTTGLAYEDECGVWWIWEPATGKLHADTPWLFTDYHHRAKERQGRFIDTEVGKLRFTPLSPRAAKRVIESGGASGVSDSKLLQMRRDDGRALDPDRVLRELPEA